MLSQSKHVVSGTPRCRVNSPCTVESVKDILVLREFLLHLQEGKSLNCGVADPGQFGVDPNPGIHVSD
jgi:hypothetical protein